MTRFPDYTGGNIVKMTVFQMLKTDATGEIRAALIEAGWTPPVPTENERYRWESVMDNRVNRFRCIPLVPLTSSYYTESQRLRCIATGIDFDIVRAWENRSPFTLKKCVDLVIENYVTDTPTTINYIERKIR